MAEFIYTGRRVLAQTSDQAESKLQVGDWLLHEGEPAVIVDMLPDGGLLLHHVTTDGSTELDDEGQPVAYKAPLTGVERLPTERIPESRR